jgi:hypothetical protein
MNNSSNTSNYLEMEYFHEKIYNMYIRSKDNYTYKQQLKHLIKCAIRAKCKINIL